MHFDPQFNQPHHNIPKPRSQSQLKQDLSVLRREASAINATTSYWPHKNDITITLTAPPGFIWATTNESELTSTFESNQLQEATTTLLDQMAQGFVRLSDPDEEDEDSTHYGEEDEPQELNFG